MLKAYEPSGSFLYQEKQRFPKWMPVLVIGVTTLVLAGMLLMTLLVETERDETLIALVIMVPVEAVIIYLFVGAELETVVTSNGFYYRWKPLHKKYRVIEKDAIEAVEIRNTPMLNYGFGWFPGLGRFYNTKQGPGVQVYLKRGGRIFFSSTDRLQLQRALQQLISSNRKIH